MRNYNIPINYIYIALKVFLASVLERTDVKVKVGMLLNGIMEMRLRSSY